MLDDNTVPFPTRKTNAERLSALRQILDHLDSELPQVIVEALFDGSSLVGAGVAALLQVQDTELYVTYSTDPTTLDQRIECMPKAILEAFGVSDAITRRLRSGDREWILVFGERSGQLDRDSYLANERTIVDVFGRLLSRRDSESNGRSYIDHLTGLPDRWATMGRIGETMMAVSRNNERAAVLFIDVNGFKQINDSFGHARGDRVLKAIAGCMRDVLRSNEYVGRIGGDEFAVILPSVRSPQDAESVAQRLYDGVAGLHLEGSMGAVSLGIGIALYPDHASNQEEWLHHADMAMYRAKRLRVPFCTYDGGWHFENGGVTDLIDYDQAYSQQFLLCFQPIFSVESRRVIAVEALVRWLHPEEGLLSASNTMKAARHWQKAENLDLWVTRKVLGYAARWQQYGIERVHVNVATSTDQTLRALVQAIGSGGVDASMLGIELENPASEEDFESVRRFVEALGKTGAKVGIDGFGSASLSLPFLESLPLSFVKLANNLLPSSGATGKGIAAVVAMAQALDWEVIATRVATAEDRRAIRDAGVKAMQGYAFAQPMTAIDFEQWLDGSQGVAFVV